MQVSFLKVEGLANDFVLVDARSAGSWIRAETAIRWCDRRRGIGADGVLTLLPAAGAAAFMHIYNADGSEPEMCGNGLRCVVLVLDRTVSRASEPDAEVAVETPAGLRAGRVVAPGQIRTRIGRAQIRGRLEGLEVPSARGPGWVVSTGNPHLVVPVGDEPRELAEVHGPRLERHPAFPEGVNIGFARGLEDGEVELVVFERGAGITQACGTGAAAAAAVSRRTRAAPGPVRIRLPGGSCTVWGRPVPGSDDLEMELEGPARVAFRGQIDVEPAELRQRL